MSGGIGLAGVFGESGYGPYEGVHAVVGFEVVGVESSVGDVFEEADDVSSTVGFFSYD